MAVKVRIPSPLQKFTQDKSEVEAGGETVRAVIDDLEKQYPGIGERIRDENGAVRRFINVYVNGEDVRFMSQDDTPVKEGDEVSIIPAIAGGSL